MTVLYTIDDLKPKSNQDLTYILAKILLDRQGAPYTLKREVTLSAVERLRGDTFPDAVEVYCGFGYRLDFCNVANDVMPLVFEQGLSVVHTVRPSGEVLWLVVKGIENLLDGKDIEVPHFGHKKPLRAATASLILALQGGA